MYNTNLDEPINLVVGLDTPETFPGTPYLSDFIKGINELSKRDQKKAHKALDEWQEWLISLPTALTRIELQKRQRLQYFLDSALSQKPSNE